MPENNKDTASGQALSRQEAEEKVAAMLDGARRERKPSRREKRRASQDIPLPQPILSKSGSTPYPEEEPVPQEPPVSKTTAETAVLPEEPEHELTPEEAEEKVAEMLAGAMTHKRRSKSSGMSGAASEIFLLELIAFSLFFVCIKSKRLLDFAPAAVFLPVMLGIGYRIVFRQFTLKEAASACKPHMALSALFYTMLILAV